MLRVRVPRGAMTPSGPRHALARLGHAAIQAPGHRASCLQPIRSRAGAPRPAGRRRRDPSRPAAGAIETVRHGARTVAAQARCSRSATATARTDPSRPVSEDVRTSRGRMRRISRRSSPSRCPGPAHLLYVCRPGPQAPHRGERSIAAGYTGRPHGRPTRPSPPRAWPATRRRGGPVASGSGRRRPALFGQRSATLALSSWPTGTRSARPVRVLLAHLCLSEDVSRTVLIGCGHGEFGSASPPGPMRRASSPSWPMRPDEGRPPGSRASDRRRPHPGRGRPRPIRTASRAALDLAPGDIVVVPLGHAARRSGSSGRPAPCRAATTSEAVAAQARLGAPVAGRLRRFVDWLAGNGPWRPAAWPCAWRYGRPKRRAPTNRGSGIGGPAASAASPPGCRRPAIQGHRGLVRPGQRVSAVPTRAAAWPSRRAAAARA